MRVGFRASLRFFCRGDFGFHALALGVGTLGFLFLFFAGARGGVIGGALLCGYAFVFFALDGNVAGVFGGLNSVSRGGADGLVLLAILIIFGATKGGFGLGPRFGSIGVSTLSFGDTQGVTGFVERQGDVAVAGITLKPHVVVGAALQEIEFGVDGGNGAFGVTADHILEDHQFAGVADTEVRFGGDNHSEGLKRGGDFHFAFATVEDEFPKILRIAFRGDRPQNIGQISGTERATGSR